MESILSARTTTENSKVSLWTGRAIRGFCILFLLFDALAKIFKAASSVKGSVSMGVPEHTIPGIGITLLICTIIYLIPRTAILGAVLLAGYLGRAIAIMVRAEQPVYFVLAFGMLVWAGLYLQNKKVHTFLL